jgi:hypothetical protein
MERMNRNIQESVSVSFKVKLLFYRGWSGMRAKLTY